MRSRIWDSWNTGNLRFGSFWMAAEVGGCLVDFRVPTVGGPCIRCRRAQGLRRSVGAGRHRGLQWLLTRSSQRHQIAMKADAAPPSTTAGYAFGPFRLDLHRQELRRGDEPVPLTPKAFDTLRVLVEADGAVVPKEELLALVW